MYVLLFLIVIRWFKIFFGVFDLVGFCYFKLSGLVGVIELLFDEF